MLETVVARTPVAAAFDGIVTVCPSGMQHASRGDSDKLVFRRSRTRRCNTWSGKLRALLRVVDGTCIRLVAGCKGGLGNRRPNIEIGARTDGRETADFLEIAGESAADSARRRTASNPRLETVLGTETEVAAPFDASTRLVLKCGRVRRFVTNHGLRDLRGLRLRMRKSDIAEVPIEIVGV